MPFGPVMREVIELPAHAGSIIIDPAKVTRSARASEVGEERRLMLRYACGSVAALLGRQVRRPTTECAITDLPERSLAERAKA